MDYILRRIPILKDVMSYGLGKAKADVVAGLTVAAVLIPQGMAYAGLCKVDPIFGLYSAIVPLILFCVFSSSRFVSVGPVAISSLITFAGVESILGPSHEHFLEYVILVGLLAGVLQVVFSLLRLGVIANFLSSPVIAGFISGAAVIIIASQMPSLLGVAVPSGKNTLASFWHLVTHIHYLHLITFGISLLTIAVLFFSAKNRITKMIAPIAILIISISLSHFLGLEAKDVTVVGDVPEGLPQFMVPTMEWERVLNLFPLAFVLAILTMVETVGLGRKFAEQSNDPHINPNQELLALGISKIGGAFTQSIPTSSSYSRSAINHSMGASTRFSSIVTALLIVITLLFLTDYFYDLPKAVLASIIVVSVVKLIDWKEFKLLFKVDRFDFYIMLATFLATIGVGIVEGMVVGMLASLIVMLYRSSRPHYAVLGKVKGHDVYRNVDRFENLELIPRTLVLRFDDQIYYGNAMTFRSIVHKEVEAYTEDLDTLILDASDIHHIDSTGMKVLKKLQDSLLVTRNVRLLLCNVRGPVRDVLKRFEVLCDDGDQHFNIESARYYLENQS